MAGGGLTLRRDGRWLVVDLGSLHEVLSWAVVGGGRHASRTVAWRQVDTHELGPRVDARRFLEEALEAADLAGAVGLLTGRSVVAYVDVVSRARAQSARCIATVGLSNALRAGDPPGSRRSVGTINLLCVVSRALGEEALVEALAIAAEARTMAVIEAAVPSRRTGRPATGTGTDCIVVAAPQGKGRARYAGKHTLLGHLIGSVVFEAIRRGVETWRHEFDGAPRSCADRTVTGSLAQPIPTERTPSARRTPRGRGSPERGRQIVPPLPAAPRGA